MPGLDDIAKSGFSELKDFSQYLSKDPGRKLDAYERELSNKTLNALDAVEQNIREATTNKLEAQADKVFSFVLKEFGLEKVVVPNYTTSTLNTKDSTSVATDFAYSDKGIGNMHTGENGKPIKSKLGTPVFADLILSHTKKVDFSLGVEDQTESVHLLWCLVEVQQTKNIVKTKVQGRDGEVKEYISDGDYMVTIRGAFANTFMQSYPKEMVKKLIKLCKAKEALKVTSEYLLMFDIHELVIEEYRFNQEEGKQNVQKFELQCSSDVPLILKNKQNVSNK